MRLIDADYLKEKGHYDDHDVFVVDYDDIKSVPTIDPVTHGRWTWDYNEAAYFCSICNHDGSGRFCPNCGAKMDEEGK